MHAKNVAVAPRQQTKPASPTKVHATTLVHQPVIKPPAPFVARRVHSHYSPQAKDLTNMRQRLNEARFNGRNRKTVGLESGHWKKWVKFCLETGISEWRDDLEANSGRDQVGYQEEIDICSAFVVTVLAGMKEGGRGRHAPLPSSAMNVLRGVRRNHKSQTPKIHMVPVAEVSDTLLGLVESYKQQHGYKMLLPRRKEPWRRPWVVRISKLRHSQHLTLAGRRVDTSLFWCSWFAMWDVLCQTGFRKAEVSVPSSGCFNPQEHLTRASLMWRIKGVEVADPPSSLLKSAGEGDCAILIPACSKTDRFGVIWGNKPIYLPIRFNADYCAALSLMKLELRFPAHNKDRLLLPLFQSMPGQPFTCHQLTTVLEDVKDACLPLHVDHSLFTYHSCRIFLCTCLGSITPKLSTEQIQAICRWQSAASVLIYNRMQPHDYINMLDRANHAVISSYSSANLPCIDSHNLVVSISGQSGH